MTCIKYTLTNTGATSINFTYRRCDDNMWEYQVQLDPNQTKNIWAIDGTYTIANYFKPEMAPIVKSIFPPDVPNPTPTLTPTPTPTEPIRYAQTNICHDETDEQYVCNCPQFASIWTNGPDMSSSTLAFGDPTGPNTGDPNGFYAQGGIVYHVADGCGIGCTTGSAITVVGPCAATPTPTVTSTQTPTPSYGSSPTPTSTLTATPTQTKTSTQTPTPTQTPTNTTTPTNTKTSTPTPTNTNSQTPTNTKTPTMTPTQTQMSLTGYSYSLIGQIRGTEPGECLLQRGTPSASASTNPNEIGFYVSGSTDLYWNPIDNQGRSAFNYYSQFTGQTIFVTISQTGSTAIYSGNTTSLRYGGNNFYFGYHPATTALTQGDVVLIQSAPTQWVTGVTVDISISLTNPIPTVTPTNTSTPTPTPTSGYTSDGWFFYSPDNSVPGPPTSNGNTTFIYGSVGVYSPNYTGGTLELYFNNNTSNGTSYLTQFSELGTSGGTITISQGSNVVIYSGTSGQYSTGATYSNLFVTNSSQMIQSASTPFVSGATINIVKS